MTVVKTIVRQRKDESKTDNRSRERKAFSNKV